MNIPKKPEKKALSRKSLLWDGFCFLSLLGIWPRYIEPKLLATTRLHLRLPQSSRDLQGFKIAYFSDMHMHAKSQRFEKRLIKRIKDFAPDLILCAGDFLVQSQLEEAQRLKDFLNQLTAPYGCFTVLGNHDYALTGTINAQGDYDVLTNNNHSPFQRAFNRLCSSTPLTRVVTPQAQEVPIHPELLELLNDTPFKLLHNQTEFIPMKYGGLNLCGLGEYMLGRCLPEQAFAGYQQEYPGIVLSHNPDSVPFLQSYPGDIILCGHTHGGQINLPWIRRKLTLMENFGWYRGLFNIEQKWLYVTRGIGSAIPFRLFARPELVFITLKAS